VPARRCCAQLEQLAAAVTGTTSQCSSLQTIAKQPPQKTCQLSQLGTAQAQKSDIEFKKAMEELLLWSTLAACRCCHGRHQSTQQPAGITKIEQVMLNGALLP
jgi:cytochrome c553